MKNISIFIIPMLFVLVGCQDGSDINPFKTNPITCNDEPDLCALNQATTLMGYTLLERLNQEQAEDNIIISPVSISNALAMTTNGAQNATFEEMMNTMELDGWSMEKMNAAHESFLNKVPRLDDQITLNLANSIWYKEGFNVKQDFIDRNTTFYQSEVRSMNFSDPSAKDQINGWVDEKTNGLIPTIIDEIPANIVMYLINATYFKGTWLQPFNEDLTFKLDFLLENGSTVQADMMSYGEIDLPYYEGSNFQAIDLAYGDSIFSMTVILPDEDLKMADFIPSFINSSWAQESLSLTSTEVIFAMPKFKLEYKAKLNQPLADMGMPAAFNPNTADLKGIAEASLHINEVIHKTFIEVDEKGTEGAAVTSVGVVETSIPQIPFITLNRPFLFMIRDNQAGSVLFIGKVMNPTK